MLFFPVIYSFFFLLCVHCSENQKPQDAIISPITGYIDVIIPGGGESGKDSTIRISMMKMQFDIPIPHSYRIDIEAGRVVEEGTVLATKMEDDANLKNRKRPLKDGVDERIQSNEKDSLAPKTIKKIRLPQKETGDGEIDIQSMPNTNVTNDASITIDRIRNNAEENISNDIVDIESVLKNTLWKINSRCPLRLRMSMRSRKEITC